MSGGLFSLLEAPVLPCLQPRDGPARFVTPDQKHVVDSTPHTPTPFKNALEKYGPVRPLQKAIRGTSTSSCSSDNETESTDASVGSLDTGGSSNLQSEESSGTEGLRDKQVTGIHLELERLRWHFVLTKLKCEQEDKEKQRLHEERMEQIRDQAVKGSVNEGLQNLLQPSNHYALFLCCFIIFYVIHTLKELAYYVLQTPYLFCFAVVLFCSLKMAFQGYRNNNKCP